MTRRTAGWLTAALIMAATPVAASGEVVPTLWGVDEDDGQLFSIDDYTDPLSTFTDYGRLKYVRKGSLRNVGRHIEAFTLDADGTAYMAINKDIFGFDEPVLMSLDINGVSPGGPNVVTFVGEIDAGFNHSGDNITGLSFDPVSGDMYALFRDNGSSVADRLLVLDKTSGSVLADFGTISGLGERVGSGEDLVFDPLGNLYVTDNQDDHLYRVDPSTGGIIAVVDHNEGGSLRCKVKFEGLAWDFMNDRLIGTEDNRELLAELTLTDGNNVSFGRTNSIGLTDVEGIAFVPEPAAGLMVLFSLVLLRRRRRRR